MRSDHRGRPTVLLCPPIFDDVNMLQVPELLLIVLVIFVIFGLTKLGPLSRGLARLRMNFEKGIAEDMIEASSDDGPNSQEDDEQ